MSETRQIDEQRLEEDVAYRYEYLAEFMGFDSDDVSAIHATAPKLFPLLPAVVEATYDKLLHFSATRRHFVPRQHGYEGELPESDEALNHDAGQIRFRKEHLRRYLMTVIGNPYDARMTKYLDVVGKIHTPKAGNKQIDVPLVQMNALMGVMSDMLLKAVSNLELDAEQKTRTLLAYNKLLWIQNDLINRHYAEPQPVLAKNQ